MEFLTCHPEQAYLLPPRVRDVLGENHVCFFLRQAVERLEWSAFEQGYVEEGRPAYHPALLLNVGLYACAPGVTSARRLEQRVREDLAFRYLAGGATPDFWTRHPFRTRHARALNDLFPQVVELARSLGMGRLGQVAVSEDHRIVEQRVTQNAHDHASLVPLVDAVEQRCGERPQKVRADAGFFTLDAVVELAERGMDASVPDSVQARELNRGEARARSGSGAPSGPSADAAEAARPGGPGGLSATPGHGGTGDRGLERTTRDAAVPSAGPGEGCGRIGAGHHRFQPHPPVAQQTGPGRSELSTPELGPASSKEPENGNSWADTYS